MHTLDQLRAGQLHGITRLDLCASLEQFPEEIFALADSLEVLNLSGNRLSDLPHDLHRLHRLQVLFCSNNHFAHVPESVGRCQSLRMVGFKSNRISELSAKALPPRLRWLILTDNCLESLPEALGDCVDLQKLMLAGNRLSALPVSLARLDKLELLRIAANRLPVLPDALLELPRLAWLAYAGNPFDSSAAFEYLAPEVSWHELQVGGVLGQGASGVIHHASWQQPDGSSKAVALKLFKGQMTSDGTPDSEMRACLAAGRHPNLIDVLGRLGEHPEGEQGLLMSLVDPRFSSLAGPPSLESCSRDIYPSGWQVPFAQALRVVSGIASALRHLHAQGITHGDLYGHNILLDEVGEVLLGDFGAASFQPQSAAWQYANLQRIEVRAFGILLEELLIRSEVPALYAALLEELVMRCQQAQVSARPDFIEIDTTLTRLLAMQSANHDESSAGVETDLLPI
ncbi:leucine-rich repeat-containing serine/threonine-protein kinase [Pseudomonas sp. MM211]|uniref:leucine-rich repeat-containing protein kinase family protein n=1 Tax=Pseudomonas sp. MM211 TaxID=2866808 RepID=UPI001CEDF809|nr:leucine-rich repeat-containing protein kinase family protein [Pseudomonas sp. MM211]UCJ17700.1 leucine-rich repeat-containing serine/threonine-protein kinase [Pseudomonas sp. MM211]